MLLTEFFTISEGDSSADNQATQNVAEAKRMSSKDNPCWSGHRMVGKKNKGGKQVPNCVPVTEQQDTSMSDIITARQMAKSAARDPQARQKYFDYLAHLRTKHGKDYSTRVHQEATRIDTVKEATNGKDVIKVDVPLLIRLLEYAREDAKTDMDLHNVAERLIALSQEGRTLSMSDYNQICNTKE